MNNNKQKKMLKNEINGFVNFYFLGVFLPFVESDRDIRWVDATNEYNFFFNDIHVVFSSFIY